MKRICLYAVVSLSLAGCKKGFLDASPNKALAIPESLADFQALLDYNVVNANGPFLAEASSDNYYITNDYFQGVQYYEQNCYVWNSNTYAGGAGTMILDWNYPYANVFTANVVISGLPGFQAAQSQQDAWNAAMGMALFYRAVSYYQLAQEFIPPYNPNSAGSDLGLPLRLTADLDQKTYRSSVKETYNQIIQDLLQSESLLSQISPPVKNLNRPSKAANTSMLARVYLSMQDYNNAWKYADSSLSFYNMLMDYNILPANTPQPFPSPNPEELIDLEELNTDLTQPGLTSCIVDSNLYKSYDSNDLRKVVFFAIDPGSGLPFYQGSYSGFYSFFYGTAVDEMYLIRAECYARSGGVTQAMQDLNTLLKTRWKAGTYISKVATTSGDALSQILTERRKELCFRGGLRWTDLRRLNQDPNYVVNLTRFLSGASYTLPPNDDRYTLLIPLDEIQLSGIQQNLR